MTPLRKKMLIDLSLAGYAEKTKEAYIAGAKGLALHYNRSPEFISEDEVKSHLMYLKYDRKYAASTLRQRYNGIRFLFVNTLNRPLPVFDFLKVREGRKLPAVLSKEEVRQAISKIKDPVFAMIIKVTYGCGLRISESLKLKIGDVDRSRMFLKINRGKGRKDRYVPLSESLLHELEVYWREVRPKVGGDYLFLSNHKEGCPPSSTSVRTAFQKAAKACGVIKKVGLHTLRHSMATHLLESGVSLKSVQYILGHKHLTTTLVYAHMTDLGLSDLRKAMGEMVSDL